MAYQRRPLAVWVVGLASGIRSPTSDPLPEHGQDRRQDQEGEGPCSQDDDRSGDSHRVDEPLGEDGQGGQCCGNGQRAEQDGVAGGPSDRGQGDVGRHTLSELLTEAGDDQQAEVDRQPDPEGDDQVEGEGGEGDHHQGQAHDAEGHGNGEHRADQRRRRSPKAPEHEEQEQQQEGQGVELGPPQVLGGDRCDLCTGHRWTAEPGVGPERRLGGEGLLQGGDGLLFIDRPDGGHHRGERPVFRDHAPLSGRGVVEDGPDLGTGPQDRDHRCHPGRDDRGGSDRCGRADNDDVPLLGVRPGHPLDLVLGRYHARAGSVVVTKRRGEVGRGDTSADQTDEGDSRG